ncbi:MAG: PEGA domain-containing protein, partial [Myxococcota bacterium]
NPTLGILKKVSVSLPPGSSREAELNFKKGELAFDAKPWADVYVDGKKVGTTPLLPVPVFEGLHTVRFVNRGVKKDTSKTVEVAPGETLRVEAGWKL